MPGPKRGFTTPHRCANKPFDIHLDPPSTEQPSLVEIKQEGKPSVYTMDFYFTNKLPSNIAV